MYCQECGAQVSDDSLFCPECGTILSEDEQVPETLNDCYPGEENSEPQPGGDGQLAPSSGDENALNSEEEKKVKKRKIIIGAAAGGALLIVIITALLMTFVKPKIKLNDYITVSYEGYERVGHATINFNMERFKKDYEKKLSKTLMINDGSASEIFVSSYIDASLDKSEGLSNGDKT